MNDPFGGNYQFNRLAKPTGGRTLYGRDDVYGRNEVNADIGRAVLSAWRPDAMLGKPASNVNQTPAAQTP